MKDFQFVGVNLDYMSFYAIKIQNACILLLFFIAKSSSAWSWLGQSNIFRLMMILRILSQHIFWWFQTNLSLELWDRESKLNKKLLRPEKSGMADYKKELDEFYLIFVPNNDWNYFFWWSVTSL